MANLRHLIDALGPTVLSVVSASAGLDAELGEVVVYERGEEAALKPGDLVLGVGLAGRWERLTLLDAMASARAPALIVKESHVDGGLASQAGAAGVALLAVPDGASWTQIILLASSVISRSGSDQSGEPFGAGDPGDLFAAANAIAELIDAPVTIEDPTSRVLAFSNRQEEADAGRAATILGRRVPEQWLRRLQELGTFERLANERGCVYVEVDASLLPRCAVGIHAGDLLLGTIWAAVRTPLSAERQRTLVDASHVVALHLLRHRLASDTETSLEAGLIGALLHGRPLAADAARQLGLAGPPFRVLAIGLGTEQGPTARLLLARCRPLAAVNIAVTGCRMAMATIGATLYVVLSGTAPPAALVEGARRLADKAAVLVRSRVLVGIGGEAAALEAVPGSRTEAEQVLRVLRDERTRVAALIDDVRTRVLLLRFEDSCRGQAGRLARPLLALRDHDARHGTEYVRTLRAHLDNFGDTDRTARELGVHTNTVRYRLHRAQRFGIDLTDPDGRLALAIELRLLPEPGEPGRAALGSDGG